MTLLDKIRGILKREKDVIIGSRCSMMKPEMNIAGYGKKIRKSAGNGVAVTMEWVENATERVFNIDIPLPVDRALKNRLRVLSIITAIIALVMLLILVREPRYFATALMIGIITMVIDFLIEYKGINENEWNYPVRHLSFSKVPMELPFMFFSCGIIVTFVFYAFSAQKITSLFNISEDMALLLFQVFLLSTGMFFIVQYFRKKCSTIIFGMLPIGISIYLAFPESWILVISIIPMYMDYYIEKRLVRSADIEYDDYSEAVATNVAISYFPTTLLILSLVALIFHLLGGSF